MKVITDSNLTVPIIVLDFNQHQYLKPVLLDIIDKSLYSEYQDQFDQISKTDYFIDKDKPREYVDIFYDSVSDQIRSVYEDVIKLEWRHHISFATFWFQQYYTTDRHEWHNHPGSNYNAVYYLELPNNGPRTELKSPISHKTISPDVHEGQILIFPSFLLHRSPCNQSKERKTVIAFNLI